MNTSSVYKPLADNVKRRVMYVRWRRSSSPVHSDRLCRDRDASSCCYCRCPGPSRGRSAAVEPSPRTAGRRRDRRRMPTWRRTWSADRLYTTGDLAVKPRSHHTNWTRVLNTCKPTGTFQSRELQFAGWTTRPSSLCLYAASQHEGPGFKSQSRRCRVTVLGKLFTPIVPLFAKQQNW